MKFSLDNPNAIYKTFRAIDLLLIGITIVTAWIAGNYDLSGFPKVQMNLILFGFALLSFWNPYDKSLRHKRIYIISNLFLIILGTLSLALTDLQFYWTIIKACFLLPLSDVILGWFVIGILQSTILYFKYPELVALNHSNGVELSPDPKAVILGNLSYYIGSSIFCIILSSILLSERESRMRSEHLAQEVETLAANVERNRIAREIHDSVGHLLTTLDIQLEVAQKQYDRNPDQTRHAIDIAKLLSGQCLQEVRYAVQSLREEQFDLNQSISKLLDRMPSSFTIHAHCHFPALPLQMSHQLYCIIQEALSNVQKHSQASHIVILGKADDAMIRLEVKDNGIGFEVNNPRSGFGLRSMEERVQLMGGQLTIASSSTEGTLIHLSIPRHLNLEPGPKHD